MKNTIKCKYCGREIEISEALQHEIVEQALNTERVKHQKEIEEAKKQAEQMAFQKLQKDFEFQIKSLQKEKDEEKERNKNLLKQLEELSEQIRILQRKDEERGLEMRKQIFEREEKARGEARKKAIEEYELKDREKDKKLEDALKQVEELKARIQQGSQQMQGEVLELEIEEILRRKFPEDKILEVKKGERGADVIQKVIDKLGRECGIILWEAKNAQWTDSWIKKLKENQREKNAHLAVLVVSNPPDNMDVFTYREGIWITTRRAIAGLALALRFDLVHLYNEKLSSVGKNEKMEVLYQYLRSTEFRHKIEAIVEAFTNLQSEQEREKRWFAVKWSRQEKELRKIIDNTYGMYGELQAVTGRKLQQIKILELPSGQSNPEE